MKVTLTRPLHIGKDKFAAGENDIPEATLKTKEFALHIKAGHILDVASAPKKSVTLSDKERADILLEKVYGKAKADATPEEAEKLSGGVKSEADAKAEADAKIEAESHDEKSKNKNKHK